jgi:nucleoid DNA-binding protein
VGFLGRRRRQTRWRNGRWPKGPKATKLTKSALIQGVVDMRGKEWTHKNVKAVLDKLTEIGHGQLKKAGEFALPRFAKFVLVKKPASLARQGINPFTKEPMTFTAKPARKVVKARPMKALKDAIS